MPHLSPTALTASEQTLILRATASNLRDHVIFSLALGTGLRLAEIVGLDMGDVYGPGGVPNVRVRVRGEIAKGGRAADVLSLATTPSALKTHDLLPNKDTAIPDAGTALTPSRPASILIRCSIALRRSWGGSALSWKRDQIRDRQPCAPPAVAALEGCPGRRPARQRCPLAS